VDYFLLDKPSNYIGYGDTTNREGTVLLTAEGRTYEVKEYADDTANEFTIATNISVDHFLIVVPNGHFADTAAAKAALAGTVIYYQLATPYTEEISPMSLAARKSGSIVQDGVVEFIDKPTSGVLTIPNSTDEKYYINAVKEVHEKQADGSWIPFDISTNDTTTVTLDTGYNDGNFYRTRYYLGLTYSLGEITYSYPMNEAQAISNNATAVDNISKEIQELSSFLVAWMLDHEARIDALENP
jgi:hypothetical protein